MPFTHKESGRRGQDVSGGTAMAMAVLRAAHQLLDKPLIFEDRLALAMIGAKRAELVRADPGHYDVGLSRGLRVSAVVRARAADDAWREARAAGARQYVVLGAGLDTAAWRETEPGIRFIEVDQPESQALKGRLLAEAGLDAGAAVFAPADLEATSLAEILAGTGFDADAPTFFTLLGATMYLERPTIRSILGAIASLAGGAVVVFDYAVAPAWLSDRERAGREAVAARAAARGEPWKTAFGPEELAAMLGALGFAAVQELGPGELRERYLAGRTDGLRKSGVSRIAIARTWPAIPDKKEGWPSSV